MNTETIPSFSIVGLAIRTTNENGRSMTDIPALWNRFLSEGIMERVSHRVDDTLYCVYTDYESDHTRPYTTVLGCRVTDPEQVPEGLSVITIPGGSYQLFTATGNIMEGIVFKEWLNIWNSDVQRAYTADFEVYDGRTRDPQQAVVDIFIAWRK